MVGILFGWTVVGAIVLALIGVGVGVMSMRPPEFGIAKACLTGAAILLWVRLVAWFIETDASRLERFVTAFLLFGLVGVGWVESWKWVNRRQPVEASPIKPTDAPRLTISELFKTEYENTMRSTKDAVVHNNRLGTDTPIKMQAYFDFNGRSKFLGYLVPTSQTTYDTCVYLSAISQETFDDLEGAVSVEAGFVGQRERRSLKDLRFSGQVVIYHEDNLTPRQAVDLSELYKSKDLDLVLRGPEYLSLKFLMRQH